MILSVSRRTDIPGFYSDWFLNRLKEGFAITKNPMNPSQISRIVLNPNEIDCIVFWTKDPMNMMDKLPLIDDMGYQYYFQFTLTPYGKDIERKLREKKEIVKTFQQLSSFLGNNRVLWRYDPILLNNELTYHYHISQFTSLCKELQGFTKLCTISFVDFYSKLKKPVRDRFIHEMNEEQMHQLARSFSEIAKTYEIDLKACCEDLDLTRDGVKPASCIDKDLIELVCGRSIKAKKDKSQRPYCGCVQSIDIGIYNTCSHGCIYCYANHSDTSIDKNVQMHDPASPILLGSIPKDTVIKDRKQ